ncbi:hypothetical protein [Allomuricauda sp. F6463D]|uniref:hypothetical protein n=1 Tax=Allomuricauda sp. F6463D TaxID=2926409 RepID=UPI001FF3AE07|nr:hypothetical protein [Muricauda sp. F6463D]MCK0160883.1 hypothetical protein [Muricauda sp. F6463D]
MKQIRHKRSLSCLFLVFFLATKLIGLHSLTHTDDNDYRDHCEICHNIASESHTPGITNDSIEPIIENNTIALQKEFGAEYNFQASGTLSVSHLFCRPPPVV